MRRNDNTKCCKISLVIIMGRRRQNFKTKVKAQRRGFTPLEILAKRKTDPSGALFLKGFTITEMLLVVVVIALVASVGGGLYVGTYKKMLVEKAARNFLLTAKYARIVAIEKQRPYKIRLDVANNGFHLATTQFNEESGESEETIVRNFYCRPVEFEGEVTFEDVQVAPIGSETMPESTDEQAIVFSQNGTAQSVVVQLGDGKTHYTIVVSAATGRAKMYEGTIDDVKSDTDVKIGIPIDLDAE